ncbi:MAG: phage holin family protein [bacterium]
MGLLVRWITIAFALFAADKLLPSIRVVGDPLAVYALTGIILGALNILVKPLLKLISLPITILTLGLFTFVINGIMLWLASAIAVKWFNVGFYVEGFTGAVIGAVIVSVVSVILTRLFEEKE